MDVLHKEFIYGVWRSSSVILNWQSVNLGLIVKPAIVRYVKSQRLPSDLGDSHQWHWERSEWKARHMARHSPSAPGWQRTSGSRAPPRSRARAQRVALPGCGSAPGCLPRTPSLLQEGGRKQSLSTRVNKCTDIKNPHASVAFSYASIASSYEER